jgi:hypothetical protein
MTHYTDEQIDGFMKGAVHMLDHLFPDITDESWIRNIVEYIINHDDYYGGDSEKELKAIKRVFNNHRLKEAIIKQYKDVIG